MTEIRPWLEAGDAPAHVCDLLREAEPSRPLDIRTQARTRQRLLAMSALPAAAGVMFWVKSVALGAVLGGAVATAFLVPKIQQAITKPQPTAVASARLTPKTQKSILVSLDASAEDAGISAKMDAVVSPNPVRPSVTAMPSAEQSQLSRETQLLEQARQQMDKSPIQALSILNVHRREFPHAALATERELMAVDVLLRLGRRDEALRRAAQLRAQTPESIYEQRLQRLLNQDSKEQR
jgi:hypothetical protein